MRQALPAVPAASSQAFHQALGTPTDDADRALRLPILAYLVKPLDFEELLGHLERGMAFRKVAATLTDLQAVFKLSAGLDPGRTECSVRTCPRLATLEQAIGPGGAGCPSSQYWRTQQRGLILESPPTRRGPPCPTRPCARPCCSCSGSRPRPPFRPLRPTPRCRPWLCPPPRTGFRTTPPWIRPPACT
ncbi:MAG: hypothetical protein ABSH53_01515 [Holophaga sp.]